MLLFVNKFNPYCCPLFSCICCIPSLIHCHFQMTKMWCMGFLNNVWGRRWVGRRNFCLLHRRQYDMYLFYTTSVCVLVHYLHYYQFFWKTEMHTIVISHLTSYLVMSIYRSNLCFLFQCIFAPFLENCIIFFK